MRLCSDCKEKERSWNLQQSICNCSYTWCENYSFSCRDLYVDTVFPPSYKEEVKQTVKKKTFRKQKEILNYFKIVKTIKR